MLAITNMKNSINKLTFALSIQENGKFPPQPQPNPKGQFEVSNLNISSPSPLYKVEK